MKYCGQCKKNKDDDDFHKNKARKDGLQYYCKVCRKDYNANRKRHANNASRENRKIVKLAKLVIKTFEQESPEEYKRIMGIINRKRLNRRNR